MLFERHRSLVLFTVKVVLMRRDGNRDERSAFWFCNDGISVERWSDPTKDSTRQETVRATVAEFTGEESGTIDSVLQNKVNGERISNWVENIEKEPECRAELNPNCSRKGIATPNEEGDKRKVMGNPWGIPLAAAAAR
jgi:hypothetical protein